MSNDMKKHFILAGSGSSGTSLLYSMLACSKDLRIEFEKKEPDFNKALDYYLKESAKAEKKGLIYGNKLPFELVVNKSDFWSLNDYFQLAKKFKLLFIYRTFDRWVESWYPRQEREATRTDIKVLHQWWISYSNLMQDLKALYPSDILIVNYEDLVLYQETIYKLVCDFLNVKPGKLTGNVKHYEVSVIADKSKIKDLDKLKLSLTGAC